VNRAPSFQFYPDKWQSHTRRLSHEAYRVYHELLCWMWQSSPDYCSIEANIEAVSVAVAMPTECVRIAMAEIQNKHAPLLKKEGKKFVSNGLKKEAEKQFLRREKAKESASHRWANANASKKHALASSEQCSSTPTPSSTPSPTSSSSSGEADAVDGFALSHPEYKILLDDIQFRGVTKEQYAHILQSHPSVDRLAAIKRAIGDASMEAKGIDSPAKYLKSRFSFLEKDGVTTKPRAEFF